MARQPRVVAELGRPETPAETAERKASSSRAYRSSQTTRNLIAALLVTLAVVAIVIVAVPRGTPPERDPIDVAAVADQSSITEGRELIVPQVPTAWRVNAASVIADEVRAWTVVYAPDSGFLRIAQGFDADPGWPSRVLAGSDIADTVTIDGVVWERYDIRDVEAAGNVTSALATKAGPDIVMVYGNSGDESLRAAAGALADQVRALEDGTP